jgi:hypothetical protein
MSVSVLHHVNLAHEFQYIRKKGFSHLTELCHIMASFGSDKGKGLHNYTAAYDWLFSRFRNEELAIFELGIGTNKPGMPSSMGPGGTPGASLRGWQAYFPHARIYGADVDSDILFEDERIRTFWTDQQDSDAIRSLWRQIDGVTFDIMIDDGLHEAPANIRFFIESFARLKAGGIYVIEDINGQSMDLMGAFARCMSHACRAVLFEELEHPLNKGDNRLVILQKA